MKVELNEKEFEMITAFRRIFMNESEVIIVDHIDKDNYKEYIGKTVKVTGNVNLRDLGLTKIPINFTEVGGYFDCSFNELTSLEGAPKVVIGSLYCWPQQLDFIKRGAKKSGFPFFRLFK